MQVKQGEKTIKNGTQKAIIEFICNEYSVYIFQGTLSKNDILIKYSKNGSRIRTPKHIHWTVDILMKLQGENALTRKFLKRIKDNWNNCKPLLKNDYETLKDLIETSSNEFNLKSFESLNKYGEYNVSFLYVVMQLLMVQEKTNRSDAYMFGRVLDELMKPKLDIFKILSTAGFGGRR